jgi:mRNA interferase RelE/StbE
MTYSLEWSTVAADNLALLDKKMADRIIKKVESIRRDPLTYLKRLTGVPLYSLRIGDYRVIISISIEKGYMLVVKIGHRKNIYEHL